MIAQRLAELAFTDAVGAFVVLDLDDNAAVFCTDRRWTLTVRQQRRAEAQAEDDGAQNR